MTTTHTSGAAIQRYKIGYHADEWGQRSSTPSGIPDASGSWVRYEDHVTALAAGQAVVPAGPWSLGYADGNWRDIDHQDHYGVMRIVWRMEGEERTPKCEALAHAVIAALNGAAAPAQPAAQQGAAYAALPESFLEIPDVQDESGINAYYSREVVLECIDAALASHGQAPAGANENAELVTLIAECRDAFPIPAHGDPIENYWSAAIEDPANVPAYLQEIAKRKQADSVLEDAAWMPLTPELLTAIESGDLGNRFWIAAHNNNEPQIGVYEWRQGRNPHGFNSDLGRYGASEITHVLPYKPPALPAASSPQARSKP